jgi:hypothetical protein
MALRLKDEWIRPADAAGLALRLDAGVAAPDQSGVAE